MGSIFLAAGFLKYTNFIKFMDERLPEKKKNYSVSHGEALAALLLTLMSGEYESLSTVHLFLKDLPIGQLLGLENYRTIKGSDFSRDVLTATLDAVASASASDLFSEFVRYAYNKFQDPSGVVSVHMDTTSIVLYHMLDDKEEKVIEFTFGKSKKAQKQKEALFKIIQGYSKDKRSDLGQVIVSCFTDDSGIPLNLDIHSGNASDKLTFANLAYKVLPKLKELCVGLKYLVCDSAGATHECFKNTMLIQGVDILTRLPDNFALSQRLIANADINSMEVVDPDCPEKSIRTKVTQDVLWNEVNVKAILVYNPSLRTTKTRTIQKRADKELMALQKAAKQSFMCPEDAVNHLNVLRQKAKYCEVKLLPAPQQNDNPFSTPTKKGSKAASKINPLLNEYEFDEKMLKQKRYCVNSSISVYQDSVDWHVERECMYVLVTTDLTSDRTASDLIQIYKKNINVESFWKKFKNCNLNLDKVFLRKRSRIKALLCLAAFNLFADICIRNKVRMMVAQNILRIPKSFAINSDKTNQVNKSPEWETILKLFKRGNAHIQVHDRGRRVKVHLTQIQTTILKGLGADWLYFTNDDLYRIPR